MSDMRELYREVILDHNRSPRNFGELKDATRVVEAVNPLCGDQLKLFVKTDGKTITDIKFSGTGCAISVASSSLMTEKVKGCQCDEALALFESVHDMLTGAKEPDAEELDKLIALGGVREYPSRVKCASLGWHALKTALSSDENNISTE
jgi:nitrogen fixation NifU-like protein